MAKRVAAFLMAVLPAGGAYGQAASTAADSCQALARLELQAAKVESGGDRGGGNPFARLADLPPVDAREIPPSTSRCPRSAGSW